MPNGDTQTQQDETHRVYGVLATGLNETLGEARDALAPHAGLLPDGTLAELDTVLAELARHRVRIAIYGEVKAGKSTLINAIAGADLSPVAFDPLTSLPVRITYGSRTVWNVGDHAFDNPAELARVMRDGIEVGEVVVETPLDLLQLGGQVDLLDTPGVGSEDRFDAISAAALRSLDAVVLVVRYPALFTQFTRRLMDGLQADIGKLFVVWNLDADCAELTAEERTRHAATLRANVAGAHELFLVDARAGLRAGTANDASGRATSGLTELGAALSRFAGSERRNVAALREAAKRAAQRLAEAQRLLAARYTELGTVLEKARGRLQAVQQAADAEAATVRARRAEMQNALATSGSERTAAAEARAEELRKQLRSARRGWVRTGDLSALDEAVAAAVRAYTEGIQAANRSAAAAIDAAAKKNETRLTTALRKRTEPALQPLAPPDRGERAVNGSVRLLRRALWRRWYLPGLEALMTTGIADDLGDQANWFDASARRAEQAADATRDERLADIARRAAVKSDQIKSETDYDAARAEFDALSRNLPAVQAQVASIADISAEARKLIE